MIEFRLQHGDVGFDAYLAGLWIGGVSRFEAGWCGHLNGMAVPEESWATPGRAKEHFKKELLTEWLTTAIKDLPEDKLAELGVMRIEDNEPPKGIHNIFSCPECGDSGRRKPKGGDFQRDVSCSGHVECECIYNSDSIASIKRGGSDNAK